MAKLVRNAYDKCRMSKTYNVTIYLQKGFDFKHGYGWFCMTYFKDYNTGFGFHRTNRFTAVKQALIPQEHGKH